MKTALIISISAACASVASGTITTSGSTSFSTFTSSGGTTSSSSGFISYSTSGSSVSTNIATSGSSTVGTNQATTQTTHSNINGVVKTSTTSSTTGSSSTTSSSTTTYTYYDTSIAITDEYTVIMQRFEQILTLQPGQSSTNQQAIQDAVNQIVPSYNDFMSTSGDPYERRMTAVKVTDVRTSWRRRHLREFEDEVVSSKSRKLGYAKQALSRIKVWVSATGICLNCKSGAALVSDSWNRRELSAYLTHIPGYEVLIQYQNDRIAKSNNFVVNSAFEFARRPTTVASRASVAATNADVHKLYIAKLEQRAEEQNRQVQQAATYQEKQRMQNHLNVIRQELNKAKADLPAKIQEATNLKNQAAPVEQWLINKENSVAYEARNDAKNNNDSKVTRTYFA